MNEDSGDYSVEGDLGIYPAIRSQEMFINTWDKLLLAVDSCGKETRGSLNRTTSACCVRPVLGSIQKRRASLSFTKHLQRENFFTVEREPSDVRDKRIGQKKLYKFLRTLIKRRSNCRLTDTETQEQLREAQTDIASLESKMDIYEQLLSSKYRASRVLLEELEKMMIMKDEEFTKRNREKSSNEMYINSLQYSLLCAEDALIDAQRAWLERLNSILEENSELQKITQAQTQTIRSLAYQKEVLSRDREELMALQDAKERMLYQWSNSLTTEEPKTTALELAVLGACTCRSAMQQPCACARSASMKQKVITELQNEVSVVRTQLIQAERIADVYKNAFEEQLQRNHKLKKQTLLLKHRKETPAEKLQRIPEILKGRKDTNDEIQSLVDMVCEKTDELIQQKLLTKLLAEKVLNGRNTSCKCCAKTDLI